MVQHFVGRQPIFDRDLEVIGFELLFRGSPDAVAAGPLDGDMATSRVVTNSIAEFGLDTLVGQKLAFFNLTETFLTNPDLVSFLPPDRVVLEILEDVSPTSDVIAGTNTLVESGFTIALDDFVYTPEHEPLLELATLVKYDLTQSPLETLRERAELDRAAGRKVLVERVETADEHESLTPLEVDYFQGYFFAKPKTLTTTGIASNRTALIQLLALVNDPKVEVDEIASVLARDVGLSVKTLRHVNSVRTGVSVPIDSIRQASILLGRRKLRNWVNVVVMAGFDGKPLQLVNMALCRARFCELMAERGKLANPDAGFTVGMLSLLDVMMDAPLDEILPQLTISNEIKSAILGDNSPLSGLLQQAVALERWSDQKPSVAPSMPPDAWTCYLTAMSWADNAMSAVG